jgi:hypothetical protein
LKKKASSISFQSLLGPTAAWSTTFSITADTQHTGQSANKVSLWSVEAGKVTLPAEKYRSTCFTFNQTMI